MIYKIVSAIFLLHFSFWVYSETLWCEGKIDNLYISSSSGLYVKPDWGDWKRLCNLNGAYNDIDSETCNSWFGIAQIALVADKTITIKVEGANNSCEQLGNNTDFPKPVYVRLNK